MPYWLIQIMDWLGLTNLSNNEKEKLKQMSAHSSKGPDIKVEYKEETGLWHIFVRSKTGYVEVADHINEEEAEDAANVLARWKRRELL